MKKFISILFLSFLTFSIYSLPFDNITVYKLDFSEEKVIKDFFEAVPFEEKAICEDDSNFYVIIKGYSEEIASYEFLLNHFTKEEVIFGEGDYYNLDVLLLDFKELNKK